MTWYEVNRTLLPLKALYFLIFGGIASFIPFKSVYQKQLGMSTTQNGIIEAIFQLVPVISTPVSGFVADRTKAYKMMLGTLIFLAGAFVFPFYFVPAVDSVVDLSALSKNMSCCFKFNGTYYGPVVCKKNYSISSIPQVQVNGSRAFDISRYKECFNASRKNVSSTLQSEETYGQTFVLLVLVTALMAACFAPIMPLLDSSVIITLGKDNAVDYGFQRLWGSAGFGLVGLCIGYFTDMISPPEIYRQQTKNYLLAICSTAILWGGAIAVMIRFVNISAPKAKRIRRGVTKLLAEKEIIFFLSVIFVSGFCLGVKYSFLFWYLQDFHDYKQSLLGLNVLETSVSEVPMFWLSGWVCKTLGCVSALSISLLAYAIRFALYTVISNSWQILAIEWLHGISFALPMTAMCTYASTVAPEGAVATLISISHTIYWGIGYMLGALFGGLVYQNYGAKVLFLGSSVACCACAAIYWICYGQFGICTSRALFKKSLVVAVSDVDKTEQHHHLFEEHVSI